MSYWFFLSYARDDRDDYLKRFHTNLVDTVRLLGGSSEQGIGFFDTEDIEPGAEWPKELAEALQTSRIFVSLYSPTYFTKEYCGKEWRVFRSRQDAYIAASPPGTKRPPLIMPVLWVRENRLPQPLPAAVSDLQYKHNDFGKEYAEGGLRCLMAINTFSDKYQMFLDSFADKLIEAAKSYSLPPLPNLQPIKEIRSAFHELPTPSLPIRSQVENAGPRYVQFIFVAGRRDELRALRQKVDFYGDEGGLDWHPYLPDISDKVAFLAQDVASVEKLRYEAVPLDANIIQRIEEAETYLPRTDAR